jgi:hypothetical protein
MGRVADALVARIDDDRPFEFDRRDLEPLWLEAANERLAERRVQIPVLDAHAKEQGVSELSSLADLVPLLFSHATYKSYPRTFVEKGRWDGLTRWLNTVSASDIADVDVSGVTTQDDWMAALASAGHPIYATSGTSGKSSFLPATPADRAFTMRCIVRSVQWQHNIPADRSRPVVVLTSSQGSSRATEYFRNFVDAYGDPKRTWFLTDEPVKLQDLSRMANLSKAIAGGSASPSDIAALEADLAERKVRVDQDWDRLAEVVQGLAGERIVIQGFWAQQWTLIERLRARGATELRLDPESLLGVGGGTKGAALPADYEQQIFSFWGLRTDRQASGYGMSELSAALPLIGDRYRLQPWIIPLILNEEGTALVDTHTGQVEGRFAFLDLAVEDRWGGVVSGDRVVADFDTPAVSIVEGSVMRWSDLRGGEDDRLTCAGTVDAFVRGFESEALQ